MSERTSNNDGHVSWRRLALALVAAPLVLAVFLTLLTYLIAAAGEPTRAGTMARATAAARSFFLYLPLFSVTVGLSGALALLRLGWRNRVAWAGTGALLGAATVALLGLVSGAGLVTTHVIVVAVLGFLLMSLVRGFAGIAPLKSRADGVTPNVAPPKPPAGADDATP